MKRFYRLVIVFLFIFVTFFLITPASARVNSEGKDVRDIPPFQHPYSSLRFGYAFYQMAFDWYLFIRDLEDLAVGRNSMSIIAFAGTIPFGIIGTICIVNGFMKWENKYFKEPVLNIREDKNELKVESAMAKSLYRGGQGYGGTFDTPYFGQMMNFLYKRKKLLFTEPIGIEYKFDLETKSDKIYYTQDNYDERIFFLVFSPLNFALTFEYGELYKYFKMVFGIGPDLLLSQIIRDQDRSILNLPLHRVFGGNLFFEIILPIYKNFAIGGDFKYAFYPDWLAFGGGTNINYNLYQTYPDLSKNSSIDSLKYVVKILILGGFLRPEIFFSQEFRTGNNSSHIDDILFGASLSLLW